MSFKACDFVTLPRHNQLFSLYGQSLCKIFRYIISLKDKIHRRQCKMLSSKRIDLHRDFAAGVYMYEAQNPKPPLHTVYVYTTYLFTR